MNFYSKLSREDDDEDLFGKNLSDEIEDLDDAREEPRDENDDADSAIDEPKLVVRQAKAAPVARVQQERLGHFHELRLAQPV